MSANLQRPAHDSAAIFTSVSIMKTYCNHAPLMPRSTPHPPTVRAVYSHHSGLHIIASNCTLYHNSISHPNSAARLQTNSEKRSSTSVPFSPHLTSLRLLAVKYTDYFKISLLVRNFPTSETSSVKGHSRCLGAQTRPACSPQAAPRFELPFFQS